MSKPSKRKQDIEALEALKREYEQKQVANRACLNGITLSIEALQLLDKEEK